MGMAARIVKQDGVLGLYNGLSASILRQLTYSTTRFGMYEVVKQNVIGDSGTIQYPLCMQCAHYSQVDSRPSFKKWALPR